MHDGRTTSSSTRSAQIARLLAEHAGDGANEDLLTEMAVTLCRLGKDGCGRGELKILNRALKELRYAFKVFAPYESIRKVSIFGSSRTPEDHPQYKQARAFAERIRERGWMVITGAGDGIMRAGNHGATRAASFGVSINLPFEQTANKFIADDEKLINFRYFFTRKLCFVKEAHAIVLFPGGFGTQDEGFESLTLVQTGKAEPTPIVLVDEPGGTYWPRWRTYVERELLGTGMISPEDMHLFYQTDDYEQGVEHILRFYSRYHSSRFVGDDFVMRLNSTLPDSAIAALNRDFADIITEGTIRQQDGPLPGEDDEHPDKARLVLRYSRQSPGRLRQLIDAVNDA